jgi:aspartate kinase
MPGAVAGVASERDVILLEGDAPPARLLQLLDDRQVGGKQLQIFGDRTSIVISRENLHDESRLRDALQTQLAGHARLVDGLAAVSVVGAGINSSYANVRTGAQALGEAGIQPAGTYTSSFRITWMVPRNRTDDAVKQLHRRFIEAPAPPVPLDG